MTRILDLSRLPPPALVEALDFEGIRAALVADLKARYPGWTADLESDPAVKLIEVAAYRELLLRARINDAARAGMLACAQGADLDQLAARYGTARRDGETDALLRVRAQIGFHQVAAAGSRERYLWHGLDAHPDVCQVDAWQVSPGVVAVALLARERVNLSQVEDADLSVGQALFGPAPTTSHAWVVAGPASEALRAARERLTGDEVRPLGIDLRLPAPDITPYRISGTLVLPPGPDPEQVLTAASARLRTLLAAVTQFRVDVHRSALTGALMGDGVRTLELAEPAADIPRGPGQLAVCTEIELTVEVRHD